MVCLYVVRCSGIERTQRNSNPYCCNDDKNNNKELMGVNTIN